MLQRALFVSAALAYAVHEHQLGHVTRIDVWLEPESFTVQDDGRGMGLDRAGYAEGLMGTLICSAAAVQLHGVGLSLIAASTPRLEVQSHRSGELWSQSFSWGKADGPPKREVAATGAGTRMYFAGPSVSQDAERAEVIAQVERWREFNPGLTIVMR